MGKTYKLKLAGGKTFFLNKTPHILQQLLKNSLARNGQQGPCIIRYSSKGADFFTKAQSGSIKVKCNQEVMNQDTRENDMKPQMTAKLEFCHPQFQSCLKISIILFRVNSCVTVLRSCHRNFGWHRKPNPQSSDLLTTRPSLARDLMHTCNPGVPEELLKGVHPLLQCAQQHPSLYSIHASHTSQCDKITSRLQNCPRLTATGFKA